MITTEQIEQLRKGDRIVFSAISGYNYYSIPPDIIEKAPIVPAAHRDSDILYKLIPLVSLNDWEAQAQIDWYRDFVLAPVPSSQFEWPVDLVRLSVDTGREEYLYYVFPLRAPQNYRPLKHLLYVNMQNDILDWRNEQIRNVAISFLTAMKALYKAGYTLNDFNINRILYHEQTGAVYLQHTSCIRKRGSSHQRNKVDPEQLSIEFSPPCPIDKPDLYSIAAILFRLMIGRLPYQGWSLDAIAHVFDHNFYDLDREASYQVFFREYRRIRCFIFDPDDLSNPLPPGSEADLPRERWNALPTKVRTMFIRSLSYVDPARQDRMTLYTPSQWLHALESFQEKGQGDQA